MLLLQVKELEVEWEKVSESPPAPARLLRSQQKQTAVGVASGGGNDDDDEGDEEGEEVAQVPQVMDPYDLADPEDFLGKLPKDFFEKIVEFL